jgi:predicted nucleic acid-binding protein
MNLVDSCGWLEFFSEGPNAEFYADAIEHVESLIVSSICLLEVFKKVLNDRGEDPAMEAVALMNHQGRVVDLDAFIAISAAKIGADMGLPLADSVILATAKSKGALIWTQDSDLEGIEGVKYIPRRKK